MIIHTKYERTSVLQLLSVSIWGFSLNCPAFDKYSHCQLLNRILSQKFLSFFFFSPSLSSGGKKQIQRRRFASTVCAPFLSLTVDHRDVQPRAHVVQHVTHDAGKKKKRSARVFFHCSSAAEGSSRIRHARFTLETNLRADHVGCAAGEAHGEVVGGANFGQPALQVSWCLDWNGQTGRQKDARYKVTQHSRLLCDQSPLVLVFGTSKVKSPFRNWNII